MKLHDKSSGHLVSPLERGLRPGRALVWVAAALTQVAACMALGMAGCNADAEADSASTLDCLPSESQFNNATRAQIANHCGTCHGDTPNFGAPNTLTGDFASLVAGAEGSRLVDRIAHRMANKTMPPQGGEPIPHQVQDTLVAWASCGAMHSDHSVGLVVDRPVFATTTKADTAAEHFDITANKFAVKEDTLDLYQCFTVEVPVTTDRFIRRVEAMIDESRVVHHVVLLRDPKKLRALGLATCKGTPKDTQYLYAWAPGAGAIEFPEGGIRVSPGERYILQIHYNNGAAVKDVKYSSGVRLYHDAPNGTEYGMLAPGPIFIAVPPQSTASTVGSCEIKQTTNILAGMPHMHETGKAFRQEIVRADGTREPFINLTGWNFEMQPFYFTPATLEPGDRLETTCVFHNTSEKLVQAGTGTDDEMCFNFMYITPPPANAYCQTFKDHGGIELAYEPGACAAEGAEPNPPVSDSKMLTSGAPAPKGGELGTHHWTLVSATVAMPSIAAQFVKVDATHMRARGQAWTNGTHLTIDAAVQMVVHLKQSGTDTTELLSLGGNITPSSTVGEGTWTPDCGPSEAQPIAWTVDGDTLTVRLNKLVVQFALPAVYTFKRSD